MFGLDSGSASVEIAHRYGYKMYSQRIKIVPTKGAVWP